MKELLESSGQRSINNVVDISNFVLLEMGHPTHIFDYSQLPYNKILVRRASKGEKFTTLDEVEHALEKFHLLITDGEKPVALAGIMGGLGSMVQSNTKKVLIESAYFDPVTIRKGSKSLGMLTESSRRFERGADPEGAVIAFFRIVSLLKEYANGELVSEIFDAYPKKIKRAKILFRKTELDLIAGCDISNVVIEKTFKGLDIEFTRLLKGKWECVPPTYRPDLENEIDLIEEVIRVFGYDNVPVSSRYGSLFNYTNPDPLDKKDHIINILAGLGFRQCYNNSLQSRAEAKLSGYTPVKTINPLSEKLSDVRTSLLPGLLKNVEYNIKNGNKNLQIFEIANVHNQQEKGFKGIIEIPHLAGVLYGKSQVPQIHNEKGTDQSFYSLKGNIDNLLMRLFDCVASYVITDHTEFDNCFTIKLKNEQTGVCGTISKDYINNLKLDIEKDVFAFIFETDKLIQLLNEPVYYKEISKFPTIERDLNFVVDEQVKAGSIINEIQKMNIKTLKSLTPVNIYRHDSLGENNKSIVYNFVFQDVSKTLEDKDVNPIIEEIISIVKVKFNAKLRT
jgi:phenylalanyl-tRNA synthetase beta chain